MHPGEAVTTANIKRYSRDVMAREGGPSSIQSTSDIAPSYQNRTFGDYWIARLRGAMTTEKDEPGLRSSSAMTGNYQY
jgi:hypothetical protein